MNQHITDYLNDYIKLDKPDYAVLLKGEWGCGKTHFIKEYIKERNKNIKWCLKKGKKLRYISLNGISSTSAIIACILFNTHHIFSWLKLIWSLLKSISLTGKSITFSPQDLYLSELFGKFLKNNILIFDDLERANFTNKNLWGFFSELLEQHHIHIVIIGDENKIQDTDYKKCKEKVVGKTLQLQAGDRKILPEVFKQIEFVNFHPLFQKYHNSIELIIEETLTVCEKTQTNYRIVKNICREFIFAFTFAFNDKELSTRHNDFFFELFSRFFIISYCLQTGFITHSELNDVFDTGLRYKKLSEDQFKIKKINESFEEKFEDFFLPAPQWLAIFNQQKIDHQIICSHIRDRISACKPNWEQLWWYKDYEDDKIVTVLAAVEEDLRNFKYRTVPEIFHTFTTMLEMSKLYAIQHYTSQAVIEKAQKYLNELGEHLEWDTVHPYLTNINDFSSGYCFHAEEYEEYNQLLDLLKDAVKSKTQKNIDEQYQNLLNDIRNRSLTVNATYQFADIYSNQSPSLLWEVLVNLDPKYFNRYCNLMVDHIVPHQLRNYRCTQQDFWQTILDKAKEYLASNKKQCKNVAKCIYIEKYFINDMESLCNANATQ